MPTLLQMDRDAADHLERPDHVAVGARTMGTPGGHGAANSWASLSFVDNRERPQGSFEVIAFG